MVLLCLHCGQPHWSAPVKDLMLGKKYAEALALVNELHADHQHNPLYHLLKLELATLQKTKSDHIIETEVNWLKSNGVSVTTEIKTVLFSQKNLLFKFTAARIITSLELIEPHIRKAINSILIQCLESPDQLLRQKAVSQLSGLEWENTDGVILLLNNVLKDSMVDVRLAAAYHLAADLNCDYGFYQAKKILRSEHYPQKALAISALGYMEKKDIKKLLKPLLRDRDLAVRMTTTGALHMQGHRVNYAPIIKNLEHQDIRIRRASLTALGKIKITKAPNAVIAALTDTNKLIRLASIHALGNIKHKNTSHAIIQTYHREKDMDCRLALIKSLGNIRNKLSTPFLISLFKDPNEVVQYTATMALGEIGTSVVPVVMDSLASPSYSLKKNALLFLTYANARQSSAALFTIFLHGEATLSDLAARGLMRFKDSSLTDSLLPVLAHSNPTIKIHAISILDSIGEKRVIPYLEKIDSPKGAVYRRDAAIRNIKKKNAPTQPQ